jgi:DNA polymerase-3 subunit epsilon
MGTRRRIEKAMKSGAGEARSGASFLAIDFETANYERRSACAIGMVRVEKAAIVERAYHLIRPPSTSFVFTDLHGIEWKDVCYEPRFEDLWPTIEPLFAGVDFLVAHNAGFDRSVLNACCEAAGIAVPDIPFECTVKTARRVWKIFPTKLPDVCSFLGIPLRHHEAASDSEACARIMIEALRAEGAGKGEP